MEQTYFTYVDRELTLRFFREDPITVTLAMGDEMDRKLDKAVKALKTASGFEKKRELLSSLIGKENACLLLSRADIADSFTVEQLLLFIHKTYLEGKGKNLLAASAGRQITQATASGTCPTP